MKSTEQLVERHSEIWALMALSAGAIDELNGVVAAVHGQLQDNLANRPEVVQAAVAVCRQQGPLSREQYLKAHRERFDRLGISEPTQAELIEAAAFVWRALHDAEVSDAERQTALKIEGMMKAMGGPPPCCDDNLFARAAAAAPE
ncbi:MAG: hypothetical protein OEZ06_05795 [Myxococcales bacterium]|nr:hypothetical protein [Myxococcales bacterium]